MVWDRNKAQTIHGFGVFMTMVCLGVCNVVMTMGEFFCLNKTVYVDFHGGKNL